MTGLADFGLITHASVNVFWSRGNEQEELCSRLYFNADSHYSVQAALRGFKHTWLTVDFVKWLQMSKILRSLVEQMYMTAQGVKSANVCSLVSFSCIGFHCI